MSLPETEFTPLSVALFLPLTLVSKQQEGLGTLRIAHHQQRLGITSGVKFVTEK